MVATLTLYTVFIATLPIVKHAKSSLLLTSVLTAQLLAMKKSSRLYDQHRTSIVIAVRLVRIGCICRGIILMSELPLLIHFSREKRRWPR